MTENVIVAEGLVKRFGKVHAVSGVDLAVPAGTVLGMLGPNGAGKTTTVRMLTTLLRPDGGRALVGGHDVVAEPDAVRTIMGLSGQYAAVDEYLTGRENLDMFGRLYHLPKREAAARADELLERFRLTEAADRPAKTYSGGMRRRLDLAAALVVRPRIIFLDEPTTGLDPRGRMGMWEIIRDLVRDGATLLLTTQYLEEADELADDIVIIDHGRVIARGTSDQLKAQVGGERVQFTVPSAALLPRATEAVLAVTGETPEVDTETSTVSAPVREGTRSLVAVVNALDGLGIEAHDVGLRRPTLDEVFLALTGHKAEAETEAGTEAEAVVEA
ncbi:ATP-binding cassette domain-containing protein [Actinomadura harenae]|uniref:ATP-binding cassette domain-containing protein n=1 Tax=Actinomadura harenae TaxID=2483351 RepID=UPI001F348D18|nr:ATP-binding cassette domain-containing protein [Actinomadura harenae]